MAMEEPRSIQNGNGELVMQQQSLEAPGGGRGRGKGQRMAINPRWRPEWHI